MKIEEIALSSRSAGKYIHFLDVNIIVEKGFISFFCISYSAWSGLSMRIMSSKERYVTLFSLTFRKIDGMQFLSNILAS